MTDSAMSLLKQLEGKTVREVKGINMDVDEVKEAYAGNVEIVCTDGTVIELEGEAYDYGDCSGIRVKIGEQDSYWK